MTVAPGAGASLALDRRGVLVGLGAVAAFPLGLGAAGEKPFVLLAGDVDWARRVAAWLGGQVAIARVPDLSAASAFLADQDADAFILHIGGATVVNLIGVGAFRMDQRPLLGRSPCASAKDPEGFAALLVEALEGVGA